MEWVALLLFLAVIVLLLAGFPVAFSLGGTALIFALVGVLTGSFESAFLSGLPSRIFGIMTNETLIAVPLFVFMGITLERARIAEDLLETLSALLDLSPAVSVSPSHWSVCCLRQAPASWVRRS